MTAGKRKTSLRERIIIGESNLFKRILLVFIFAFILVMAIIYLSLQSIKRLQRDMGEVIHSQQVISGFDDLLSIMKDAETGQRGFLLTRDSSFLEPYESAAAALYSRMLDLRQLLSDNQDQLNRLKYLDSLILKRRALLKVNIDRAVINIAALQEGKRAMDQIRVAVKLGKGEELKLMQQRKYDLDQSRKQTRATITIFSLMALALVVLPLLFTLFELRKRLVLQQLLNSVLNSSLNGIQSFESIRDLNGNIIDFKFIQANETSHRMAYKPIASFVGKSLLEVFPDQRSAKMFDQYKQVVENGIPMDITYESSHNGTAHWYHATAVKLRDGFTLTVEDITQSKRAEIALENNVLALKRSNAELEQFAYVASHDLQEPLRKILTFIDRIKSKSEATLNENSLNYLQRISNAAMRMRVLINDLLSYSRMTNIQFEILPVNLNELIADILNDLEVLIQQKSARVSYQGLPSIQGMKIQLQQLFQNLIINSLKFSVEDRPPEITIRSEFVTDPDEVPEMGKGKKRYCRIEFTDNGIGFDEKYEEKIFQIFQRLHGRTEYEGTGIGLAICKKIVENHKGTIIAKGYPGEGATFIITLPVKQTPTLINEPDTKN
ncbi:MAG TPA: CHASE3 domain-containing protein [Chitinophagales bacterium]|nr:CHASE3 domain-containing protein [Chitinophagales bacterium]